jgi:pimeloyl-ACP methyl ester carboxylesterase
VFVGLYTLGSMEVAEIERDYPPIGSFVEVPGGRLQVLDLGREHAARGTLVLLHGMSSNLREMAYGLGEPLSARYRVLVFDRPGHGWSARSPGTADASPARQAALVSAALTRLGIGKAVILGHSWGGAVAAAMALDQPAHVAGLVLISPAAYPELGHALLWYDRLGVQRLFANRVFDRAVIAPLGLMLLRIGVAAVFAPNPVPPHFLERSGAPLALRPSQLRADNDDLFALRPFLMKQAARYGEIRVPTLVITGDADHVVSPPVQAEAVAAAIPGARLVVLPGVGHMPQYVRPERVRAEITAFMDRLPGTGTAAAP